MLNSPNIPNVPTNVGDSEMLELFRNFGLNWSTLSPALWLLLGTLFGLFVLKLIKNRFDD